MSRELRTTIVIMAVVLIVGAPLIFAGPEDKSATYLPMVFQLVPSPTPTSIPVKQLENGGFEQGNIVWVSSGGSLLILRNTGMARTGDWSAFLGSSRKAVQIIQQEVDVTAEKPYLVYWSAVYSDESKCTYDYGYVRTDLLGYMDTVREFCKASAHADYRKRVVDLRRAIGHRATVQFIMSTDVVLLSVWHIDDISLQATP